LAGRRAVAAHLLKIRHVDPAVGVQYQQGLAQSCAASDFAEGAIGFSERFPIPDESGQIIRPGKAIPCINEVDMGTAIPQTMLWRLLDSLGLPAETTLHDIRWGSEFEGTFYWDFEISGSVPFEHIKGGIAAPPDTASPPCIFPKAARPFTARARLGDCCGRVRITKRHRCFCILAQAMRWSCRPPNLSRRRATTYAWPLLNCTLDGVGRDDLMAGHQSNHITVAYVDEVHLQDVLRAFVAQALQQNIQVLVAGQAHQLL